MRLVIEFVGGPRDGERLLGTVDDGALTEARTFYGYTGGARVGSRFWCTCEYTTAALRTIAWVEVEQLELAGYRFHGHIYEIVDRQQQADALLARARHLFPAE